MDALAVTLPQGPELIIILVVVILLFGAKKLPELGSSVGKSIKNFKSGIDEGKESEELPQGSTSETVINGQVVDPSRQNPQRR